MASCQEKHGFKPLHFHWWYRGWACRGWFHSWGSTSSNNVVITSGKHRSKSWACSRQMSLVPAAEKESCLALQLPITPVAAAQLPLERNNCWMLGQTMRRKWTYLWVHRGKLKELNKTMVQRGILLRVASLFLRHNFWFLKKIINIYNFHINLNCNNGGCCMDNY